MKNTTTPQIKGVVFKEMSTNFWKTVIDKNQWKSIKIKIKINKNKIQNVLDRL